MADKKDLDTGLLDFERLVGGKTPEESVRAIYAHVEKHSHDARQWYWVRLGPKRVASTIARIIAFVLAGAGTVIPLYASIWSEAERRLTITQGGVVAVVLGGLVVFADRMFGWSSGWLRYMSTALSMERLTQQFRLEWAGYMLAKASHPPTRDNVIELFEIARHFHESINTRVREETDSWVAEFASSMGALEEMLRKQRESAEKALQQVATEQQKALPGAVQIMLRRGADTTGPVAIALDDAPIATIGGNAWALTNVTPGLHIVAARAGTDDAAREARKAVQVPAGVVTTVEIDI